MSTEGMPETRSTEGLPETKPADGVARARKMAMLFLLAPVLVILVWASVDKLMSDPVPEEEIKPVVVGQSAPQFGFPLLGGGEASLNGYRGKVVLVNIWATWCPPCIDEMPDLQNLYAQMKRDKVPFEILGVSIDALGGDAVQRWVERFGITFPILLDPRGKIKKLYRTTGVPETFIVDPDGRLVEKIIGPRQWNSPIMVSYLKGILQSKPGASPASAN